MKARVRMGSDGEALVTKTLDALGIAYQRQKRRLVLRGDRVEGIVIDLTTGDVQVPERVGRESVTASQRHAEAKFRAEAARQGVQITSRSVDEDGNVILKCSMP